jgi:hypothetical protein
MAITRESSASPLTRESSNVDANLKHVRLLVHLLNVCGSGAIKQL